MKNTTEKRRQARFYHRSRIIIENVFDGDGLMLDFSKKGFYFESDSRIALGGKIRIGIINSPYENPLDDYDYLWVTIQRIVEPENSRFKYGYGVEIADRGRESQTAEPAAEHAARQDLRKYLRRKLVKTVHFVHRDIFYQGLTQNISSQGLLIHAYGDFRKGESLQLIVPDSRYDRSIKIDAEIMRVEEYGIAIKLLGIRKSESEDRT